MPRPQRYALAAVALALSLAACAESTARVTEPVPPAVVTSTVSPTPQPGPEPEPSPEAGTVPPAWLGTRVLPRRPEGFGEVQPTRPELRNRSFTLPDTLGPLPGDGFASQVEPAPRDVLARSTWQPDCPVRADPGPKLTRVEVRLLRRTST